MKVSRTVWGGGKSRDRRRSELYLSPFGTIPDFDTKLATIRKYEISCTIIIQALSQLKTAYKDSWEVIVGNCDSLLFLGGSDTTTLEYFSKLLGKETIRSINNSRSYGRQGSYSMSYNKTGRELMTPDELRVMDNSNCVLFIRGLYPFFSKKYKLENHPNYHLSGDANDKNLFNVKDQFNTGRTAEEPRPQTRAMRILKETERADTREAERQIRINTRPVQRKSVMGRDLGKIRALDEEFPSLRTIKDPENITPEEEARVQAETEALVVQTVANRPEEVAVENYSQAQMDLFDMFYSFYDIPADQKEYEEHELGRGEED